mgnify:CR=1 FL=1
MVTRGGWHHGWKHGLLDVLLHGTAAEVAIAAGSHRLETPESHHEHHRRRHVCSHLERRAQGEMDAKVGWRTGVANGREGEVGG